MNAIAVNSRYTTYFFSTFRCMKFAATKYALINAMPKAVINVSHLMPMNGPATLTHSSAEAAPSRP